MLIAALFGARGDYAKGLEVILVVIAIVFAIMVALALIVGTKLTRSITSAVDQLYEAPSMSIGPTSATASGCNRAIS